MLSAEMRHVGEPPPAVPGACGGTDFGQMKARRERACATLFGIRGHPVESGRASRRLRRDRPPSSPEAVAARFAALPDAPKPGAMSCPFYFILYKICELARMHSSMADFRAKPEATFRHRGTQEVASRRPDHVKHRRDGERAYCPGCASNGS